MCNFAATESQKKSSNTYTKHKQGEEGRERERGKKFHEGGKTSSLTTGGRDKVKGKEDMGVT